VTGPRDWDKELADIDKAIARMPAQPAPPSAPPGGAEAAPGRVASPGAVSPAATRRETTTTWLRVLLAAVLAGALPFWPYAHACGVGLYLYLAAAAMVIVAGIWAAISTWQRRRARAHALALLVILWGAGLVAHEVLPRVGYTKHQARWTCG
jgi:hypothetical protein